MSQTALIEAAEELLERRVLLDALTAFDRAVAAGEDHDRCAGGRWTAQMLLGDFEAAWRESDAIAARGSSDPARLWRGEPIAGRRVMLRCLHGFGDSIQFLRYAPQLAAAAASLTVEVAPRFVALAHCMRGVSDVVTWGEQAPAESRPWDVQIEVMELPYLVRTQLNDLPGQVNYLNVPAVPRAEPMSRMQVGLAWTAGRWNLARSLSRVQLEPILAVAGCDFWTLEHMDNGIADQQGGVRIDPLAAASLTGLATRIAQLDLVITVDTVVAHLAGAMGIRTWVLLQYAADWRWMHARETSPWYPLLHLIRQPRPGDWTSVIESTRLRLQQAIETHPAREVIL